MKPEVERVLIAALLQRGAFNQRPGPLPRDVISDMLQAGQIKNAKQAWRTLEKWTDRNWYEYGVSLDLGWLTDAGFKHFSASAEE